jgi:hypothetical protein
MKKCEWCAREELHVERPIGKDNLVRAWIEPNYCFNCGRRIKFEEPDISYLRWLFMSKYKKLMYDIECVKANRQRLHLPNGIVLDFTGEDKQDG